MMYSGITACAAYGLHLKMDEVEMKSLPADFLEEIVAFSQDYSDVGEFLNSDLMFEFEWLAELIDKKFPLLQAFLSDGMDDWDHASESTLMIALARTVVTSHDGSLTTFSPDQGISFDEKEQLNAFCEFIGLPLKAGWGLWLT